MARFAVGESGAGERADFRDFPGAGAIRTVFELHKLIFPMGWAVVRGVSLKGLGAVMGRTAPKGAADATMGIRTAFELHKQMFSVRRAVRCFLAATAGIRSQKT